MTASRYSKTVIPGIAIVVSALVALTIAKVAQAADPPGINLPTAPVTATFVENFTPPGGTSYFTTTLSSVPPGYDVGNSEYIAWCADPYSGPPPATNTPPSQVTLLSTYGTSPLIASSTVPWNKINYLLNHKNGEPNNVVQPAIWFLITGVRDAWNPPNPTWSCPLDSACDLLVTAADTNGGSFVPGPGQVVAVFMYNNGISFNPIVDDGWQDTIMEVPVLPYDLGDLPDTSGGTGSGNYQTLFADNGPNHLMTNNLYLGACVDNETNGQPNTEATGDNSSLLLPLPPVIYGTCDTAKGDEDGVTRDMSVKWTPNTTVSLEVRGVGQGALACWIDWDGSGNLGDNANKFIPIPGGTFTGPGPSPLPVPIPANYVTGTTLYVRCRLFPANGIPGGTLTQDDYVGYAPGGEVEDYRWTFTPTAVTLSDLRASTLSTGERLMALLRSWLQR